MNMRTRYFLSGLALAALFYSCQKEVKQIPVSSTDVSNSKKVTTVDPVTISVIGTSQVSIDIKVTAGLSTGAPSGFSIQWATTAQLAAYTGPVDQDGWPLDTTVFCKASFSGNACVSRYALKPGKSVTVSIGNLLLDNGASTTCPNNLACGTDYVFRAFAHANSCLYRSLWSNLLPVSTASCGGGGNSGSDGT